MPACASSTNSSQVFFSVPLGTASWVRTSSLAFPQPRSHARSVVCDQEANGVQGPHKEATQPCQVHPFVLARRPFQHSPALVRHNHRGGLGGWVQVLLRLEKCNIYPFKLSLLTQTFWLLWSLFTCFLIPAGLIIFSWITMHIDI